LFEFDTILKLFNPYEITRIHVGARISLDAEICPSNIAYFKI
jgi:hypothetical protein